MLRFSVRSTSWPVNRSVQCEHRSHRFWPCRKDNYNVFICLWSPSWDYRSIQQSNSMPNQHTQYFLTLIPNKLLLYITPLTMFRNVQENDHDNEEQVQREHMEQCEVWGSLSLSLTQACLWSVGDWAQVCLLWMPVMTALRSVLEPRLLLNGIMTRTREALSIM